PALRIFGRKPAIGAVGIVPVLHARLALTASRRQEKKNPEGFLHHPARSHHGERSNRRAPLRVVFSPGEHATPVRRVVPDNGARISGSNARQAIFSEREIRKVRSESCRHVAPMRFLSWCAPPLLALGAIGCGGASAESATHTSDAAAPPDEAMASDAPT